MNYFVYRKIMRETERTANQESKQMSIPINENNGEQSITKWSMRAK